MKLLNSLLEKGVIALLIFTPLAFGSVQKWSVSLLETGAFLLLLLFLYKLTLTGLTGHSVGHDGYSPNAEGSGFEPLKQGPLKAALILFILYVFVVLLQLLPLPDSILGAISPAALHLYKKFAGTAQTFHTISTNRYATRQELLLLLAYISVFVVIIGHYRTKAQLRSLVMALFYTGFFLVLFALVQKGTWNGRMYWFYPIDDYLLKSKLDYIWGPYINRNHFAGYLEMIIPFGLGLLVYVSPGRKASSTFMHTNRFARLLANPNFATFISYFIAVLIMTAALFATLSRGGIAACVISFIFFVWITRKRHALRNSSLLVLLLALVISAVVIFAAWDRIENRFDNGGYVDRVTIWKDSRGIVRDYPLFGSGLGAFESTFLRYQSRYNTALFDHAHNDYIEVFTDSGVIGAALIGGVIILLFSALYRQWRVKRSTYAQCIGAGGLSASVALAVHSLTDFNLHIPANALLFAVVIAITYVAVYNLSDHRGASLLTPNASPLPPPPSLLTRFTLRIAILLTGGLLLLFPVTSFVADYQYGRISRILDDPATEFLDQKPLLSATLPDYLSALKAAETAQLLEPSQGMYAATVAEQYTRLGRWANALALSGIPLPAGLPGRDHSFAQAERYLQVAIACEPTNPDHHLALADIYEIYRKDPVKVDTELKLTGDAFPFNGAVRNAVAMHYLLAGRKDKALEQARLMALCDDSYILNESPGKADTLERMPQWYMDFLCRSYLYSAFEIAWRVTKDPKVIQSMAPASPEASNVLVAFADRKGIELPK